MRKSLLRPFLVFEFLVAIQVVFTVWSQVGGQYHLDLMFWPWKLGLSLAAATLITALTASLAGTAGTGRIVLFVCLLLAVTAGAGVVTYYYHLNEPDDQEEDGTDQPARVTPTRDIVSSNLP